MNGELQGRIAVVTGAARGQGRAHAVRLAQSGAAIIAIDICKSLESTPYAGATWEDLLTTVGIIESAGGTAQAISADVRDLDELCKAIDGAADSLGGIDIVVANAGIAGGAPIEEMPREVWQEVIDVNLTGVWNTMKATIPRMLQQARGGSIIITSSANGGIKAPPNLSHYAASKHGVIGMMRSLAVELGDRNIRVNTVHPTAANTDMIHNEFTYRMFRPELPNPGRADVIDLFKSFHSMPIAWVEPEDVANAVAFLASDRARYITGICLPVDGGLSSR